MVDSLSPSQGYHRTRIAFHLCSGPKTDTNISKTAVPRRERELQAWADDVDFANGPGPAPTLQGARNVDELTFGPGSGNGTWDQFAVNEKLFGVKAAFDEDAYTTKLDRNAPDFKERERKAAQIASEIMNVSLKRVGSRVRMRSLTG